MMDVELMQNMIHQNLTNESSYNAVLNRIISYVAILDSEYSANRKSFAQGGFLFLITDCEEAKNARDEIIQCYDIDGQIEFESIFLVNKDTKEKWKEELYLRGSDDAVVIIYPLERKGGES